MYKIIKIGLLLGIIMTLLTSCSSNFNKLYIADDSDMAQETINQVIEAISNDDATALRNLFAKNICNEVSDIDKAVLELLEFIQGDIISYNSTTGVHVSKKSDHGKIVKSVVSYFIIETNEDKYHIAINECVVDTIDKNNVGIYSFNIISDDDWTEDYIYGGLEQATIAGIIIEGKTD